MDPTTLTLLLQAVQGAMKTGYLLFNKPKKSLYQNKELENTVQRLIANNQADIVNKTLMNQLTSQAKSLGARVYQQQQHALEIGREQGLLSSGQYAQGLLTAGAQTQATVGAQAQQAETTALQNWQTEREGTNQLMIQLAQAKDEARRNYKMAKEQWKAELFGAGMDIGTVGASALANYITNKQNEKSFQTIVGKYGDPSQWDTDTMMKVYYELLLNPYTRHLDKGKSVFESATSTTLTTTPTATEPLSVSTGTGTETLAEPTGIGTEELLKPTNLPETVSIEPTRMLHPSATTELLPDIASFTKNISKYTSATNVPIYMNLYNELTKSNLDPTNPEWVRYINSKFKLGKGTYINFMKGLGYSEADALRYYNQAIRR